MFKWFKTDDHVSVNNNIRWASSRLNAFAKRVKENNENPPEMTKCYVHPSFIIDEENIASEHINMDK